MAQPSEALSGATRLGPVQLLVRDPDASSRLWADVLGLARAGGPGGHDLAAGGRTLVRLVPGAMRARADKSLGLFHVAIALPSRLDLGRVAARLVEAGVRVTGQDHLLSESIYTSDPDGLNIELYVATTERGRLLSRDGDVKLVTVDGSAHSGLEPLPMTSLTAELEGQGPGDGLLPTGSTIGHIHFRSNAPDRVLAFYTDVLGFAPHVRSASFGMFDCGTGPKPHMIAFNLWGGRGLTADAPGSAGLASFSVEMPATDLAAAQARLRKAGVAVTQVGADLQCVDPDGNRLLLVLAQA